MDWFNRKWRLLVGCDRGVVLFFVGIRTILRDRHSALNRFGVVAWQRMMCGRAGVGGFDSRMVESGERQVRFLFRPITPLQGCKYRHDSCCVARAGEAKTKEILLNNVTGDIKSSVQGGYLI